MDLNLMKPSPLDAIDVLIDLMGEEKLLSALVRSLPWDTLEDHLAFIIKTHDLLDPHNLTQDDYNILESMKERE